MIKKLQNLLKIRLNKQKSKMNLGLFDFYPFTTKKMSYIYLFMLYISGGIFHQGQYRIKMNMNINTVEFFCKCELQSYEKLFLNNQFSQYFLFIL